MRSFAARKIDVYFGPTELGAPDDLEQAIVNFIDGATSSLDIAVQEIDSLKIAEAIINARWRGVTTNVFVEQDEKSPGNGAFPFSRSSSAAMGRGPETSGRRLSP